MDLKRILMIVLLVVFVVLAGGLIMEAFRIAVIVTLVLVFLGLFGVIADRFL